MQYNSSINISHDQNSTIASFPKITPFVSDVWYWIGYCECILTFHAVLDIKKTPTFLPNNLP